MVSILIVEDNYMIADQIEECVVRNGYDVCGIASNVATGVALYREHKPQLVIVDIRLEHGELGTDIAAQLAPFDKVGILYVTGSSSEIALSHEDGHACLAKPYIIPDLLRALQLVSDIVETGQATPPFPSGFQLLSQGVPESPLVLS